MASSFNVEFEVQARTAAKLAFAYGWTSTTIAQAPHVLRDLSTRTGGLRPGQMLLVSPEFDPSAFAYGLWWPWGDAISISMRVGLEGLVHPEAVRRLREIFGATG